MSDKIVIRIDSETLARAESLRAKSGESRNGLIERALRALLADEDRQRR